MDFFSTLYWADIAGRYTMGKSIYPPLNYIFLKLVRMVFIGGVTFSDTFALRASGFSVVLFVLFSYLIVPILILRNNLWSRFSVAEKTLLYFSIILSTPMLFALERGNLILYTLFILPFVLSHSGLVRAVSIAVLVNLKPYFALLIFYYLIRRDWKQFWKCTLITGLLFLISGVLLDQGFINLFFNIFDWTQKSSILSVKEVMAMPSSISAFSYVLNSEAIQQTKYGYFFNLHAIAKLILAINWIVIFWLWAALYNKNRLLSEVQILAVLLVTISNFGIWIGGYSLIYYIPLLPVFLTMKLRNVYLVILILLFAPLEYIPLARETIGEQYSYLTNSIVDVHWILGIGSVLNPMLNFLLMATLLFEITQLPWQKHETGRDRLTG